MKPISITGLRARAVLAPLATPITTAHATIPEAPLALVDLETDQGIVGRSYLFTYTPLVLKPLCELLNNLAEGLKGKSVDPVARFADMEGLFRLLGRQGLTGMAMAGVDMALWDAHARAHDQSVAAMLGAGHDPVPCYESFGVFDAVRDRDAIESAKARGFEALKIKVGGTRQADREALRDLRYIIGDDMGLMIDYNQSLTVPEAILRINDLGPRFDLTWVEEPVGAENLSGHRAVRTKVNTPIQTGENWWLPDDAARAIEAQASDHAMLDIMKIGGVTGWMRASAMAQAASLPVSSHLFIEATAHVMAATPNRYLLEHLDLASSILRKPYEVTDGTITPMGPGLGIEWDERKVAQYSV